MISINLQQSDGVLSCSLEILNGLLLKQVMANTFITHNIAVENDFVRYYCLFFLTPCLYFNITQLLVRYIGKRET